MLDVPWLADVKASDQITGDTVISGRVAMPDGRAAAKGAEIVLASWPSESTLRALRPGDFVRMTPIAKTTSDSAGRYSLRIDAKALQGLRARPELRNDKLNVEVTASTFGGVAAYASTLDVNFTTGKTSMAPADPADARRAKGPSSVDLRLDSVQSRQVSEDDARRAPSMCGATFQRSYGPRWVDVGGLYSIKSGGYSADQVYSRGASSTLGAGYSVSAAAGSWTQSGSFTSGSDSSVNFTARSDSNGWINRTQFEYGRYYGTFCSPRNVFYYRVRQIAFVAGASSAVATVPNATYCTSFSAGSGFTKESTTSTTFSAGADLSGVIGIDLSAQTGYSTTSRNSYSFSSSSRLCGTNGYPGSTPGRMVVR